MSDKPAIYKGLLWDVNHDTFDYNDGYLIVIERVVERGTDEEWAEINRYYGSDKVRHALMEESKYIHHYAIDRVCRLLHCALKELLCYRRNQSKKGHFI